MFVSFCLPGPVVRFRSGSVTVARRRR